MNWTANNVADTQHANSLPRDIARRNVPQPRILHSRHGTFTFAYTVDIKIQSYYIRQDYNFFSCTILKKNDRWDYKVYRTGRLQLHVNGCGMQ